MAITITCYGGVNEIGGSKILLEDGGVRLFFDFGTSFGKRYEFFEEYLKPRPGVGLLDLLRMELLPPLEGIYRRDLIPIDDPWPTLRDSPLHRELSLDGVLLSHAHVDHSGYISFLEVSIPVYATAMTSFMAKAMQDSGQSDFEREVCYANPREPKDGILRTGRYYQQRPFVFLDGFPHLQDAHAFWEGSPAKTKPLEPGRWEASSGEIGGLPLRCFPVDHSIFGASGFAVETREGWIGYTGDLRLHGERSDKTKKFVEEMRQLHPLALICEGTYVGRTERTTEDEVFFHALRKVQRARNLVVADFGPRNVERLIIFHRIAQETGRQLVVLGKDAYLLEAMRLVSEEVPDLSHFLIYKDRRSALGFWEQSLRQRHSVRMIEAREVRENQGDYILCFSFWDIKNLIDIEPVEGSIYIYSSSEAFNEEMRMDLYRLRNWLGHFGMEFAGDPDAGEKGLHASGHASGPDLLRMIRDISPHILISVHTLDPGYFAAHLEGEGIDVRMPRLGEMTSLPS